MMTTGRDRGLPWLEAALDPRDAGPRVIRALAERTAVPAGARVLTATLRRHKPGRRALIQYQVADPRSGWRQTTLGKTRARGLDHRTIAVVDAYTDTSLGPTGGGVAAVPRSLGVVAEHHLWLQEEVVGRPGFVALAAADGDRVAFQIGVALAEFHGAGPATERQHTIDAELATLDRRFGPVTEAVPALGYRLRHLMEELTRLAQQIEPSPLAGVHRDFYPDQVVIGSRVFLLDLDLYAIGDPALDLGNFAAHLIEFDLRTARRIRPLTDLMPRFLEGYRSIRALPPAHSIDRFETLALARHITISTAIAGREHTTEALLRLCESRVAAV